MRILFFLLIVSACIKVNGQSVNDKASIRLVMDKVNTYQLKHPWTDSADYNWIRGTWYTGVMACYQATGDKKYLEQCEKWGNDYKWEVPFEKPFTQSSGANLLTCAQTWLECYLVKKDKKKIAPTIAHFKTARVDNPLTMPLDWYYEAGERYVDAIYVAAPVLAMLYKITGDEKYSSWMDSFFWDVYGKLFDKKINLFYRDLQYVPGYTGPVAKSYQLNDSIVHKDAHQTYVYQKTAAGKKVIWSRGNGWAFAGLARILKYLPQEQGNFKRYLTLFQKMAESLKERQQEDGYWRPNLDDPMDFPYKETSGTGFFVYGLAWGINNGYLNRTEFKPTVDKGWKALNEALSKDGKVQWGQLEAGSPDVVKQEDSHEYVTGTFLLAASEVYKMQ